MRNRHRRTHIPALVAVVGTALTGACLNRRAPATDKPPLTTRPTTAQTTTKPLQKKTLQTQPARAPRPVGSIESAVLDVNGTAVTCEQVLRRAQPKLKHLAKRYDQPAFAKRAQALVYATAYDFVSELLLYQEVTSQIRDEKNPALDKIVDQTIEDRVVRDAGSSRVRFDKMLAEQNVTIDDLRTELRRQILTRQYLRQKITPMVVVTRDDLWEYYQAHQTEFDRPGRVRVLVIEIDPAAFLPKTTHWPTATDQQKQLAGALAEKRLVLAQKRIADGDPFKTVAKDLSTAPSGKVGGDIGWIGQGSYRIEQIETNAFTLPVNQLSDPITVDRKTYLIQVQERQDPQKTSFAQAQARIKPLLEQQQYRDRVNHHLAKLQAKAHIGPVLPFVRTVLSRAPSYHTLKKD